MRTHGSTLRANETRTRMALIDPLLTMLGWDTADPTLVTPEYHVEVGWADYALQGPGNKPAAIIEAKRLGSIVENHLDQAVNYCIQQGIAYAGITDGSHWQLYRTFEPVPLADKRVLDLSIANMPAHECALQLLLLWRPNLASGKAVPASVPLLDAVVAPDPKTTHVVNPPNNPSGWVTLSEYNLPGGTPAPSAIRFSDGAEKPMAQWYEMLTHTVGWLHVKGSLTTENTPVRSHRHRYVVNTEPKHPNGDAFGNPTIVHETPFWVNINLNAAQIRKYVSILLQYCDVDPATVQLRVGE